MHFWVTKAERSLCSHLVLPQWVIYEIKIPYILHKHHKFYSYLTVQTNHNGSASHHKETHYSEQKSVYGFSDEYICS